VKKHTEHWVELAQYDLETAKHMLTTRRYVYVVFLCHLTIEKLLKACITEFTETFPPPIHSLEKLTKKAGVQFPDELAKFVEKMSEESVATRYPEDLKDYDRKRAKECLAQTKQIVNILERQLKSAESSANT